MKFTVFFLMMLGCLLAKAQLSTEVSFNQLTTQDGLSHHQINTFFEDKYGFLWIGTLSGLNHYDGYEFTHYYHDDEDENSLANNSILTIHQGPEEQIWINTGEGLSIYDLHLERFVSAEAWLNRLAVPEVLIREVVIDKQGAAWFCITGQGLRKHQNDSLYVLDTASDALIQLATNDITDIALDVDGDLWLLHSNGIVEVVNVEINKITRKFQLVAPASVRVRTKRSQNQYIRGLEINQG